MRLDETPIIAADLSLRLGDYALLRRIGAGAAGDVWLARDAVGKLVAVKVIDRARLALLSSKNREERALALIRTELPEHPHLIRIFHVGNEGDKLYYVMELADDAAPLVDGRTAPKAVADYRQSTLAEIHAIDRRLPPLESIAIVRQVLSAVACLHNSGFVHRDIKPSNILCVGGVWKLADIGLMAAEATLMTTVGTPDFMPPTGPIDRTADLYALGKLLYCLTTGSAARSFPTIPSALLRSPAAAAIIEINEIVTTACSLDPARRFKSAALLDQALNRCAVRIRRGTVGVGSLSRRVVLAAGCIGVCGLGGLTWLALGRLASGSAGASPDTAPTRLFDGATLAGWRTVQPNHGEWSVQDGALQCARTAEYKTLLSDRQFGAGIIRATVSLGHERARLGIGYLHNEKTEGPLFLFFEDKYTWLRGYRVENPADAAGTWLSFPGPILGAGDEATFEIEYGPQRVVLRVNGADLQVLPGVQGDGHIALHVWADDAGSFHQIEFLAAETDESVN